MSCASDSTPALPPPSARLTPFLPKEEVTRNEGTFRLKLVRHTWGIEGNLLDYFRTARKEGKSYEAFEGPWFLKTPEAREQLTQARAELGLEFSALIFTDITGKRKTPAEHFTEFKAQIESILPLKPFQINCHSGIDRWSFAESLEFFTLATEYSKAHVSVPVMHETHRGRALYNPWVCRDLVKAIPDLRLTADYSHWVNVCERLIDTESDVLELIASRVIHIHSRVGFEQGPQVNDPRAPEWAEHVRAHERWWEMIFKAREKEGATVMTLTPEYGPADKWSMYCPRMPYTCVPVVNVGDVCDWSASRMQHLFKDGSGGK